MSIRSLTERLTRNWLFQRTLVTRAGRIPMLVSPEGGLRYLFKKMRDVDPSLVNQAEEFVKEGDIVWDVGANLGLFAFTASKIVGPEGKVIMFEPDSWLVYALRESAKRQAHKANIVIVPAAVGKENALRTFAIAERSRSSNHLAEYGTCQAGGVREEQTVSCVSLDFVLQQYPGPNVLKIDVEEAECEVLAGARLLIERHRPIVLAEVSDENSDEVTAFFGASGYDIYDGQLAAADRRPLKRAPWATLAIPR